MKTQAVMLIGGKEYEIVSIKMEMKWNFFIVDHYPFNAIHLLNQTIPLLPHRKNINRHGNIIGQCSEDENHIDRPVVEERTEWTKTSTSIDQEWPLHNDHRGSPLIEFIGSPLIEVSSTMHLQKVWLVFSFILTAQSPFI